MSRVNLESGASLQDAYDNGDAIVLAPNQPIYIFSQDASPLLRGTYEATSTLYEQTAEFSDAVTVRNVQVAVEPSFINQEETVVIAPVSLVPATNLATFSYPLPANTNKYVLNTKIFVSGPQGPYVQKYTYANSRPENFPGVIIYASNNPNYVVTNTVNPTGAGIDHQLSFSDMSPKQVYVSYSLVAVTV